VSSFDPFAKEVAAVPVVPTDVGLSAEQKRRLEVAPPLEEYVAREVAITQRMIDNGVFRDEDGGVGRLARTASYARWRWNGWVSCEIESL
jgi:hypothetical protein